MDSSERCISIWAPRCVQGIMGAVARHEAVWMHPLKTFGYLVSLQGGREGRRNRRARQQSAVVTSSSSGVQILAQSHACCVVLGKLLKIYEPQFPLLGNGVIIGPIS